MSLQEVTPPADHEAPVGEERIAVWSYPLPNSMHERIRQLDLPAGYGLIGGGARAIASELLCDRPLPVRDIDIAAFTDYTPDESQAHAVALRLMPDDYAFGHGVQISSLERYFGSRDFTINELAVVGDQLLITPQAEQDLRDNVIRPTEFEHDPDRNWYLSPSLAIKSVLMQTVLERMTGQPATIEGVYLHDYHCDVTDGGGWTRPFYVALGFQKALEHGEDVADEFLDRLIGYGMVRASSLERAHTPDGRLTAFAEELEGASNFVFRGAAAERLKVLHEQSLGTYSLGDLLYAVDGEVLDRYDQYHEVAQGYGGQGRQYTDESKY